MSECRRAYDGRVMCKGLIKGRTDVRRLSLITQPIARVEVKKSLLPTSFASSEFPQL